MARQGNLINAVLLVIAIVKVVHSKESTNSSILSSDNGTTSSTDTNGTDSSTGGNETQTLQPSDAGDNANLNVTERLNATESSGAIGSGATGADVTESALIGSNMTGSSSIGSNMAGSGSIGSNMTGWNVTGSGAEGSGTTESGSIGSNVTGWNATGSGATGSGSIGSNATGSGSIGLNATGSGSIGSNVTGSGSIGSNATGSGSIGSNATGSGSIGSNVTGSGSIGSNVTGSGSIGSNVTGSGSIGSNATGSGSIGSNVTGSGSIGSNVTGWDTTESGVNQTSSGTDYYPSTSSGDTSVTKIEIDETDEKNITNSTDSQFKHIAQKISDWLIKPTHFFIVCGVMLVSNVLTLVIVFYCLKRKWSRKQDYDTPPTRFGSRKNFSKSAVEVINITPTGKHLASDDACKSGEGNHEIVHVIRDDSGWCIPYKQDKRQDTTEDTGV